MNNLYIYMYMYIVYNTHTSTHHTHIHTLSQETKSVKGVMIFILKKEKKENVFAVIYVWKICAMSCGCEINLQSVACARRNLSKFSTGKSFSGQKFLQRERERERGRKNHANC